MRLQASVIAVPILTLCLAALPAFGQEAAPNPVTVVESIYEDLDNRDEPPGGYNAWATDIAGLWADLYARIEAASDNGQPIVFPGAGPEATGNLTISVSSTTGTGAQVRAIYQVPGYDPVVMMFSLLLQGDGWKIVDAWPEAPPGEERYLSDLIQTLP